MPTSLWDFFVENFFKNSLSLFLFPFGLENQNPHRRNEECLKAMQTQTHTHTHTAMMMKTNEQTTTEKESKKQIEQRYNFCIANE